MRLTLTVISAQAAALGAAASKSFDENGGTIGRAQSNAWMIPDSDKFLSARHAVVSYADGAFHIKDTSTNGVFVNGSRVPLGRDGVARLADGDRLVMGEFELAARIDDGAEAPGEALGEAADEAPLRAVAPPPLRLAAATGLLDEEEGDPRDPLDLLPPRRDAAGAGGARLPGDWDDGGAHPSARAPAPALPGDVLLLDDNADEEGAGDDLLGPPSPAAAPSGGIPTDWDPFGDEPPPGPAAPAPPAARATPAPARPYGATLPDDFDELLPGAPVAAPPPPVAGADRDAVLPPAPAPVAAPAPPPIDDDLDALLPEPAPAAPPPAVARPAAEPPAGVIGDDLDDLLPEPAPPALAEAEPVAAPAAEAELDRLVPEPARPPAAPLPVAPPLPPPVARAPRPEPGGDALDDLLATSRPVMPPRPAAPPAPPPAPPRAARDADPDEALLADLVRLRSTIAGGAETKADARPEAPRAAGRPPQPAGSTELGAAAEGGAVAAFFDAAGLAAPEGDGAAAEQMRAAGAALREMAAGMAALLAARRALKDEFRVAQTMVRPTGNNPLKFAASPEEALKLLLVPGGKAYRGGAEAVREAFDDIQAHEMATVLGMQAAIKALLVRVSPSVLEQRFQREGVKGGLLGGNVRAKYWEMFQHVYDDLAGEAEDTFQEFFGDEFVRAYQEHVRSMRGKRGER